MPLPPHKCFLSPIINISIQNKKSSLLIIVYTIRLSKIK
nr:MAG TPA: hypothetical protein [Caudoviricetes sp.]